MKILSKKDSLKTISEIVNTELEYIYSVISVLALVGIIWLQIKMRKDSHTK